MRRLGYTRYVAQGGDVGSAVTDAMARQAPDGLVGVHLNLFLAGLLDPGPGRRHLKPNGQHRRGRDVQHERQRLLPGAGHPAADDRLPAAGFTRRSGRLAVGPRHRQLLQDLPRVSRRRARGPSDPRPDRRQHHAVLADRHRCLSGQVVLGERTGRSSCGRPSSPGGVAAGRFHRLPRRDLRRSAQLGQLAYPNLTYYNAVDKGGHFAAWEEPQVFSEEVRAAFRSLR